MNSQQRSEFVLSILLTSAIQCKIETNANLYFRNALNVVKDDLIMKVDELTRYVKFECNFTNFVNHPNVFPIFCSEQEMFKEEIKSLQTLKSKLLLRVQELEEELKATKEEAEKLAKSSKSDDEVSCFV